jgi:DNA helicase INO80
MSEPPMSPLPSEDESAFDEEELMDLDVDLADDIDFKPANKNGKKSSASKTPARSPAELERKIWSQIARVQIPKAAKMRSMTTSTRQSYHKRLSAVVAREARRGLNKNKSAKEVQTKAKRVMREMLVFWKGNEKREREGRKVAEKQALDKAKKEEEMREAKRAAKKLNFLITQTELYSHFVGSKMNSAPFATSGETDRPCSPRCRRERRDCGGGRTED